MARKMTARQKAYAQARFEGMTQREAAIEAGCPGASAGQAGNELERHPAVVAELKRLREEEVGGDRLPGRKKDKTFKMPKAKYTSSKEFLIDIMNHPEASYTQRQRAAETLLPYQHARVEAEGKKVGAEKRANKTASSGGKFGVRPAPGERPKLHAVGGRG